MIRLSRRSTVDLAVDVARGLLTGALAGLALLDEWRDR